MSQKPKRERRGNYVALWLTQTEMEATRELAARRGAPVAQVLRDGLYLLFEANGRLPRFTTEERAGYSA